MPEGGHAPSIEVVNKSPNGGAQRDPTNVTAVLCARHVSVHSKPAVDAANLLARHGLRNERLHSTPELVVESLVDDPVEIMGQDARVLALRPHRCVWDELDGLAGGNDSRTFFRREHVSDEP
jgi:hypothetical protein